MSSSRANAAARQRRAGDTQTTQQQSSYNSSGSKTRFVQQQQEPPQPPVNPKLSISDAIALITLRLGRVENIVSNYDPNAVSTGGNIQLNYDENMRMVDEQVFNSIVSRLEALEKGRNVGGQAVGNPQLEQRLSVLEKNQKMLIEKQQQTPVVATTSPLETTIVNDVAEEKLKLMEESIQYVKSELSNMKDLLLKLQSFTMETNQKLADIVFDVEDRSATLNNAFMMSLHNSEFNVNGGITILDGEQGDNIDVGDEHVEIVDEIKNTIQSTNLKELVKKELMNEETVVEEGAPAIL
jgi:PIN domain nuclease of toxin-antitoxin system